MAGTTYLCCEDHRRAALEERPALNGIDYLEVADLDPAELDSIEAAEYAALPAAQRARLLWQRRLTVAFVNPLLPGHLAALDAAQLSVDGGERADSRNIAVTRLSSSSSALVLRASRRGDFSTYRLRISASDTDADPPAGFDPLLSVVDFSFKVDCPSEFDCVEPRDCPPEPLEPLDIDYLTRDYGTFRRLMLDRITALSPGWRDRHAADLGMTLVETVAYVADYLSYRQDAIATEAYLRTARSRVSVRRHARLVDYPMHDGCNARAWVQVLLDPSVPEAGITLPHADPATGVTTKFLTRASAAPRVTYARGDEVIATQHPEVFELLRQEGVSAPRLYPAHEVLPFYTWGASDCCLPKGATRAALRGHFPRLAPGDVLVFEEVLGPRTGLPADADRSHRHAVRLTAAALKEDPLGGRFLDEPSEAGVPVTSIAWSRADALPFPLCVSATISADGQARPAVVSVARGNIVLVDHGRQVVETLQPVPSPTLQRPRGGARCAEREPVIVPPRFRPALGAAPLTHAAPLDGGPASRALASDVRRGLPAVTLAASDSTQPWTVRRDLLASSADAPHFVAESDSDGTAWLRFGDGRHGRRPAEGVIFSASYRVGNGTRGNVGADAIAHIATTVDGIAGVRNPLPAAGGVDPEDVEDVRRFAPVAFRTQERAVTAEDYASMTERHPQVQQAAGTFRWTGSWRTVFVTVDPFERVDADEALEPDLRAHLEPYRMAGHDVAVDMPRYVPVEIEMEVCAKREYFRSDVKRALHERFSSRVLADGTPGLFHPDRFTFGQPIFLSALYAAAQAVDGVETVRITRFGRQGQPDPKPLADGRLDFGRLEIAQLENSRDFPDRGVFRLRVAGGK